MILIRRVDLVEAQACETGMALFDSIVQKVPEGLPIEVTKKGSLRVAKWGQAHDLWLWRNHPSFANWLAAKQIVPGANLSGANLSGANLYGAYLSGANLSGANLSRANLSRANLSGANLYGAYLSRANLSRADLYLANMSMANLSRANLSGANLSGADLYLANLSGAFLSGAFLSRANLSWAYRPTDPPAGWHTLASGYLEKDKPEVGT